MPSAVTLVVNAPPPPFVVVVEVFAVFRDRALAGKPEDDEEDEGSFVFRLSKSERRASTESGLAEEVVVAFGGIWSAG